MRVTPVDLYAFGPKTAPRAPRLGREVVPDSVGMVGPEGLPLPKGPSTYADLAFASLTGHYHVLPEGTPLPDGIGVVADGRDVVPNSPHPPTHHTIYPAVAMHVDRFCQEFMNLPWRHGGKKK